MQKGYSSQNHLPLDGGVGTGSCERRGFLRASLLTAGGMFASAGVTQGVSVFSGQSDLNVNELPAEWVRRQGPLLHAYGRYLSALRLRHISVQQIITSHARKKGSVWNALPGRESWRQMSQTLRVADEIAVRLSTSVKGVTSAFRSPSYNARCPGAKPNSLHKDNIALDLQFHASTYAVARAARNIREEGKFRGGVGQYTGFTHVDTRGYNVDW
ncbi:MAG TPA: hypothetical protein DCQ96_03615 [Verrucomicrobiales bacterium]|nr:hypothetical protein [Verrucomicrobiales bacterium]